MVRVADNVPEIGTVFEWDIEEIMERWSSDLRFYTEGALYCNACDLFFGDAMDDDGFCICDDDTHHRTPSFSERWDAVLNKKRYDDHFEELKDYIEEVGFTRTLTARPMAQDDGTTILELADGHHRLAVAIEMGLTTVPITVYATFREALAEDSGDWHRPAPSPAPAA